MEEQDTWRRQSRDWRALSLDVALFAALLSAFYTGVRLPSLWSLNYFIPSVFDGFYRRSLVGTVLYPLGALRFHYYLLASLQTFILGALLWLLMRHALRSGPRIKLLTIVFLFAPTGGFLFHMIGYVDGLLYLMLLCALAVKDWRIGLALMVASLFVHEMAAFTIVPFYLARFACDGRYRTAFVQGLVLLSVFGVIYFCFQVTPQAAIDTLMVRIGASADYAPRKDYYDVFSNAFAGERMQNWYGLAVRVPLAVAVLAALLAAATFVRRGNSQSYLAAACVLVACLAPLALGFVGWDVTRWIFLSLCSSFLMMILFGREFPVATTGAFIFLMLAFSVRSGLYYFDDLKPRGLLPISRVTAFVTTELPALPRTIPAR